MPKSARILALSVVAAGTVVLVSAALLWPAANLTVFTTCVLLAAFASTVKVQLPGIEGTSSPSFLPVIFAIGFCPWQHAVLIAAVAGFTQSVWKPQRTPSRIQVAFNAANFALAAAFAAAIASSAAAHSSLVFVIGGIAFQVIETWNVAWIIALLSGARVINIWRECQVWSFPYHLCGGLLDAAFAQAEWKGGVALLFIAIAAVYLTGTFYREFVQRTVRFAPQK